MMTTVKIDNLNLFKQKLETGINLFTGAGFSVLPDADGKSLPVSQDLVDDICRKFHINPRYRNDLEKLSNVVTYNNKQEFQDYLREKYTVNSYNTLYDVLNRININAFITTNIDNIIHCVMGKSKTYFLHDAMLTGALKHGLRKMPYIALHGNVTNHESNLYFGKDELSRVGMDNRDLFNMLHTKLLEAPTVFLGYGFHDDAVYNTIVSITQNHRQDIWIQCRPDSENIDYFRDLGYFVIEMDTKELLTWIDQEYPSVKHSISAKDSITELRSCFIPSQNDCTVISREDYFCNGNTDWYCVFHDYAYRTKYYDTIRDRALSSHHVIFTGIPFSGKSTLLMLCAISFSETDEVLYLDSCIEAEAQSIVNKLSGKKVRIFFDSCCEDIKALRIFLRSSNISVVGCSDDYSYESSKHLIDDCKVEVMDISELSVEEAQRIWGHIPDSLHHGNKFLCPVSIESKEKMSMWEIMSKNVKSILSKNKVHDTLERIKQNSMMGFELISLTTYLSVNRSALSMDVLVSFFDTVNYDSIREKLSVVNNYLSEADVSISSDMLDQDYYSLRSTIFLNCARTVLKDFYTKEYGSVVRKFIKNVSPYKIYHYKRFARSAYDARFFHTIFGNGATDLYDWLYDQYGSAYTLQQRAIYKMVLGKYEDAFSDIDLAINMSRNNFSMINTRAVILFEANKGKNTPDAVKSLHEVMATLKRCYCSDRRKIYHAQRYAEFALYFARELQNGDYLKDAIVWLNECVSDGNNSYQTKRLLNDCCNFLTNTEMKK